MFNQIAHSWSLMKASWAVLCQDTELLLFPFMSTLASIVVVASYVFPGLLKLFLVLTGRGHWPSTGMLVAFLFGGFLCYVVLYFIIFFFNSALVAAALIRLDGGVPTLSAGFRIAFSRFWSILAYSCIASTVGVALRAIEEYTEFGEQVVAGVIGAAWTMATYLVVPVLVARDVDAVEALSASANLLKKTWGMNVVGYGGFGIVFNAIHFIIFFSVTALFMATSGNQSMFFVEVVVLVAAVVVTCIVLLQSALSTIYSAALYRFATKGATTEGFDREVMKMAFVAK